MVVSAASGAVGSVVGQLAKAHGCRAVGIAGGKDKCDYVVNELGFDACVDYRAAGGNLFKEIRAAAPKGIDVYFENVGGAVQAAVVPQLNDFARVPLCGLIAHYNEMQPSPGPDWRLLLIKRATVTGFIVSDHFTDMEGFWKEVPALVKSGKLKYREDIVKGIDNAPPRPSSACSRAGTSASCWCRSRTIRRDADRVDSSASPRVAFLSWPQPGGRGEACGADRSWPFREGSASVAAPALCIVCRRSTAAISAWRRARCRRPVRRSVAPCPMRRSTKS